VIAENGLPAEGGSQLPGDCNQDGRTDLSDVTCIAGYLFQGSLPRLPCGDGEPQHPSNTILLDHNGDRGIDLSDAIAAVNYLFQGGPPHAAGLECIVIPDCDDVCEP